MQKKIKMKLIFSFIVPQGLLSFMLPLLGRCMDIHHDRVGRLVISSIQRSMLEGAFSPYLEIPR